MGRGYRTPEGEIQVGLFRYGEGDHSVARILELGLGGRKIGRQERVVIKPNFLTWDENYAFPLYGVFTTSRVLIELIEALKDFGARKIFVAEGTGINEEFGSSTPQVFKRLGLDGLKKKYGIELTDLNQGPFVKVGLGRISVEVSKLIVECDFFIDVPVLKTHSQATVSLGFKNLKGCLSRASRKKCHLPQFSLDECIALLGTALYPDLTLIDGLYGLEKGALYTGNAYRMDLLIASRDMLAADIVGCEIMGIPPEDVGCLSVFAKRNKRSLRVSDFKVVGNADLEAEKRKFEWDWPWREDNTGPMGFEKIGLKGISVPKYDSTMCTGCSFIYSPLLVLLLSAAEAGPYPGYEILTGKKAYSQGGYEKTFLVGNCMIGKNKKNPNIQREVPIPGCPPRLEEIVKILKENGIRVRMEFYENYRQRLLDRYKGRAGFDEGDFYVQ